MRNMSSAVTMARVYFPCPFGRVLFVYSGSGMSFRAPQIRRPIPGSRWAYIGTPGIGGVDIFRQVTVGVPRSTVELVIQ
jgi:hypothetical protein